MTKIVPMERIARKIYLMRSVNPVVAKVEGLQSKGGEGAAVVNYRKPFPTQDL